MDRSTRIVDTPLGPYAVTARADGLARVKPAEAGEVEADGGAAATAHAVAAARALAAYFAGTRRSFEDLVLAPAGTPFQRQVWRALRAIPFGDTASYGEIARRIGRPGAARAVGSANHGNPLAIVVPCHRVVGVDGSLVGYAGGTARKRWLLRHEEEAATSRARSPAPARAAARSHHPRAAAPVRATARAAGRPHPA